MALTIHEGHVKAFVLHGSTGSVTMFRKAVVKRIKELGLLASDFEPFAEDPKAAVVADVNVRDFVNWADAVKASVPGNSAGEQAMNAENVELLGRIAATLDRRYGVAAG